MYVSGLLVYVFPTVPVLSSLGVLYIEESRRTRSNSLTPQPISSTSIDQIYLSRSSNCLDGTSNHDFYTDDPTPQCFACSHTDIAANDYLIFKCGAGSSDTISTLTATDLISSSTMHYSFATSAGATNPSSQSDAVVSKATEPPSSESILQKESNRIGLPATLVALATLWVKIDGQRRGGH